jgi:hypothetical protein
MKLQMKREALQKLKGKASEADFCGRLLYGREYFEGVRNRGESWV